MNPELHDWFLANLPQDGSEVRYDSLYESVPFNLRASVLETKRAMRRSGVIVNSVKRDPNDGDRPREFIALAGN